MISLKRDVHTTDGFGNRVVEGEKVYSLTGDYPLTLGILRRTIFGEWFVRYANREIRKYSSLDFYRSEDN